MSVLFEIAPTKIKFSLTYLSACKILAAHKYALHRITKRLKRYSKLNHNRTKDQIKR